MNSNPTGYPTTMQQHANPMLAATAGYPVQSGSPSNQQFPYYASNPMAAYPPQMQQPSQARPGQMQQHSFNPMQIQTSGPGGAMMPANMVGKLGSFCLWLRTCCSSDSASSFLFS